MIMLSICHMVSLAHQFQTMCCISFGYHVLSLTSMKSGGFRVQNTIEYISTETVWSQCECFDRNVNYGRPLRSHCRNVWNVKWINANTKYSLEKRASIVTGWLTPSMRNVLPKHSPLSAKVITPIEHRDYPGSKRYWTLFTDKFSRNSRSNMASLNGIDDTLISAYTKYILFATHHTLFQIHTQTHAQQNSDTISQYQWGTKYAYKFFLYAITLFRILIDKINSKNSCFFFIFVALKVDKINSDL